MNLKFPTLGQIVSQYLMTFRRFPLAVVSALVTTLVLVYLIELHSTQSQQFETLMKLAFVSGLGIFLFTALRLMGDKNPLCLLGIVGLVAYYFILPDMRDASSIVFMRHFFLNLMFFIMILWAPFWKSNPSNELAWEWAQNVLFSFLTSILFSIVLYVGLSAALVAMNHLFSLGISGKRYGQLALLVGGLFGVNYFLSQLPKEPHTLATHSYTKAELIFTKYLLTPLVIIYFLILYAYTFKIVATASFPKGILAWIIMAFSVVAITAYLFWTPLWSQRAKKYSRYLWLVLLLQTIMLGVAIGMRITDYGWTENRYMVALFGIWLFAMSLYFLLFKDAKYRWLFITITASILVSQIGPLSAYSVGKSSQQKRLKALLKNRQEPLKESSLQTRYEISNKIEYLYRRHGIESLKPIIPKIVAKYQKEKRTEDTSGSRYYGSFPSFATRELGFNFVSRYDLRAEKNRKQLLSIYRPKATQLKVKGYDWKLELNYFKPSGYKAPPAISKNRITQIDTVFNFTPEHLIVQESNTTLAKIPLKGFLQSIIANKELQRRRYRTKESYKEYEKLNYKYSNKNISLKLLIYNLTADQNGTIENMHATLLYKRLYNK